jgi:hypothetical protein
MSSLLERLANMAGVALNEAEFPRLKAIKIHLSDVGLDDQPDEVILQFADKAVETNEVFTIADYRINHVTGDLEFYPMLRGGELSPARVTEFRDHMMQFLSDPENLDTYESVQERKLTPAELKKREEIAKAIEKEQPGIDKSKKMAIATAQAKKMSESEELDEAKNAPGTARVSYTSLEGKRVSRRFGTHDEASKFIKKLAADHSVTPIYKGKPTTTFFNAVKEDAEEYNQPVDTAQQGPLPQGLAELAQPLGFQTLDTQATPGQSQQVSADTVRTALLAAYNLGKAQAGAESTPAAQQTQSGGLPLPTPKTSADRQQVAPIGH